MSKLSKYIFFIEYEKIHFLFNTANGAIIALQNELLQILQEHKEDIDRLSKLHPDFFAGLQSIKAIVEYADDEGSIMIEDFKSRDKDPTSYSIIINPTLDCNLRCWYCYETHKKGSIMGESVLTSVKKLIDAKLSDSRLTHFSASFFGGEPLLGWDKVVLPILEYATQKCKAHGIKFSTGFTTNGVLLSEKKFNELAKLGLSGTSFQISFDGNRKLHDNFRVGADKAPTFDKIIKNVKIGAAKGFTMSLRFNYTPDNLESFKEVLSEIDSLPEDVKKNIICNFQGVWQTKNCEADLQERALNMVNLFNEHKFETDSDIQISRQICYADMENCAVINYDGLIFKCTAREFCKENSEGVLNTDGSIVWNEKYTARMARKYANEVCRECDILPICNGGCSQNKLDNGNTSTCPFSMNDNSKNHRILASFLSHVLKSRFSDKKINELLFSKKIRVYK